MENTFWAIFVDKPEEKKESKIEACRIERKRESWVAGMNTTTSVWGGRYKEKREGGKRERERKGVTVKFEKMCVRACVNVWVGIWKQKSAWETEDGDKEKGERERESNSFSSSSFSLLVL